MTDVAPILGGVVLQFTNWRGTFAVQVVVAAFALPIIFAMRETLLPEDRLTVGVWRSFTRLGVVLKNPRFAWVILACAFVTFPFMGYVSSAAYIYEGFFGIDTMTYSIYFAICALMLFVGSGFIILVSGRVRRRTLLVASFLMQLYSLGVRKCTDRVRHDPFCVLSCGDIDEKSVKTERKRRKNVGTIGTNGTARALTWRLIWQLGTKVRRSWHHGSKARNAVTTSSALRQNRAARRGRMRLHACLRHVDRNGSEGRR